MLTLLLLSMLASQDQKSEPKLDLENTKLLVFDSAKEMTLKILKDGKVELSVKEESGGQKVDKSYAAASAAEFRTKYPDLVKKYDLARHLGGESRKTVTQDEFEEWWKELKKGVPRIGPIPGLDQPMDEDLQKYLEEELGRLRRPFRFPKDPQTPPEAPGQAPVPGGRQLGVRVQEVGETLRDQLSLKENEGVIVAEVKPGSLAEKMGIKEHDIFLKLDGKPITDAWQFRADILSALGRPEFPLEILRAGKRETIKVKTSARKDE